MKSKIIHKMYLQTLLIAGISVLVVILIRSAGYGIIGNWITSMFCRIYDVGWEEGVELYWRYVRNYYVYVMGFAIIVLFLIFFRILLSGFTRYFDEIIKGINTLADGTDEKIKMSNELHFVETKLQQVKDDLAQRKKEKEEAEKRKDELIVYLAHDIKTPLASVIGYLNLLIDSPSESESKKEEYLHIALDKSLRLEGLINDFFEITRSHAQGIALDKKVVSLAYLMEQVVDEAYPIFQKAGKTVLVTIDEYIRINVDAQKMARVFTNLLKNAIYYCDGDGPIQIMAESNGKEVKITFINDGQIEEEQIALIFEKFSRLDNARQTKTGGSGLGLAIAKEIVKAHDGDITAECENGKIEISIYLPV